MPNSTRTTFVLPAVSSWLVLSLTTWAGATDNRFVEFSGWAGESETKTYDLDTVQFLLPGRFSIVSTTIGSPEVIRFELKVLPILKEYCEGPTGEYTPPQRIFLLGSPDAPVKKIEVENGEKTKVVSWNYPYTKFGHALGSLPVSLYCDETSYGEKLLNVKNGDRQKELFDCKRGLNGSFIDWNKEPFVNRVYPNTWGHTIYFDLCHLVTNEAPYEPPSNE